MGENIVEFQGSAERPLRLGEELKVRPGLRRRSVVFLQPHLAAKCWGGVGGKLDSSRDGVYQVSTKT